MSMGYSQKALREALNQQRISPGDFVVARERFDVSRIDGSGIQSVSANEIAKVDYEQLHEGWHWVRCTLASGTALGWSLAIRWDPASLALRVQLVRKAMIVRKAQHKAKNHG